VKDAVKDVASALRRTCHRTWRRTRHSGPGRRHATTAAAAVFAQLALRWGCNWAAPWYLARAVGKRFRVYRAKRLYVGYRHCMQTLQAEGWRWPRGAGKKSLAKTTAPLPLILDHGTGFLMGQ